MFLARLFYLSVQNCWTQFGAETEENLKWWCLRSYELFPQNLCSCVFHIVEWICWLLGASLWKNTQLLTPLLIGPLGAFTVADVEMSSSLPTTWNEQSDAFFFILSACWERLAGSGCACQLLPAAVSRDSLLLGSWRGAPAEADYIQAYLCSPGQAKQFSPAILIYRK